MRTCVIKVSPLRAVVEVILLNPQTSGIVLGENAEVVPQICLERRGSSVIDISVKAVPRGITATGMF